MGLTCSPCHYGQCAFNISYEDGSGYRAAVWNDTVSFGAELGATSVVGAIYMKSKGHFEPTSVDGIIGVAYQPVATSGAPTVIDNLVRQGQMKDMFSICLDEVDGLFFLGETGLSSQAEASRRFELSSL